MTQTKEQYHTPTSEELKQDAQSRAHQLKITNYILTGWSFQKVKTWEDVAKRMGVEKVKHKDVPPTHEAIKEFISDLKATLELTIKNRYRITPESGAPIDGKVELVEEEKGLTSKENYGFVPSPNENCFLYWFQKKACKELMSGFDL